MVVSKSSSRIKRVGFGLLIHRRAGSQALRNDLRFDDLANAGEPNFFLVVRRSNVLSMEKLPSLVLGKLITDHGCRDNVGEQPVTEHRK